MPDSPPASAAFQHDLLDKLPLGVVVYRLDDPDDPGSLRLVQANEAASRAVGFDVRPDIGRTFREASPQVLETEIPALYAKVALSGEEHDLGVIEYEDDRIERASFRVRAFPMPDRHVGVMFEDVTERRELRALREAQAEREASADLLRIATEAAQLGIWDLDPVAGTLLWDDRCNAIFGFPPGTPVDYDLFLDRLHPDDRDETDALVRRALDPEGPGRYDTVYRAVWPGGSVHWVHATGQGAFEGTGAGRRAVRFTGTVRDVTEERAAALALEESEARYRFLGETLQQQVWTAEPDGRLDYVNDFVLRYFGRSYDEMVGEGWQGVVHEEDLPLVTERWADALETGDLYETEFRLRRAEDGAFRWHIARANALRGGDGRIVKWFGANTDIHEKKTAERLMAETNRALEVRVAERTQALGAFSEDLRVLHRITTARHETPDEAFQEYLRAGCAIFEMPIGILSETPVVDAETGERSYRLHTVESPVPEVRAGIEMPLGEAFCDAVVERGHTVSYADVCEEGEEVMCKAAHAEHGLRAFIGTPLVVDGALFGTLNFVSPVPRPGGFEPHEHELVEVMAESVTQLLSLQRAERARAEADARYRSIVHTVEEGLMLVDSEGTVLMSNPAVRDMLGLGEDRVLERVAGVPRRRILREDGTPFPEGALPEREVFRTGRPVRGVVQGIAKPGGETCWYSVNARAADRDADGTVATVVVSFTDVTEQRRAETQLRESEAQLRKAQEIARIGSWRWNIASDEISWSDELFRIFGLDAEGFDPSYESYLERLHPEVRDRIAAAVQHAIDHKQGYELDHRVVHPDGSVRYVHSLGEVVLGERGEVAALQGTAQDVTAQREAQREVERLSLQLERILDAAGEGIYGLDLDGRTTFVNHAAGEMTGWEPDALVGREQHAVLHHHRADGSPYPAEACPIHQTLRDGQERRVADEVFWRKDGSSFPVEYVAAPMWAEDAIVGAVVVFQNVADRVAAEQALQRYADDLEERNAELEQFAYVASHDLQEPLRMVSSFLQLLQRRYADQLDETADEYIAYAVDGAKRMQKLIQDLLSYSRVGTRGKAFKPVDMNRTAETVLTDLGPALDEAGATVEAGDLPTVAADETQMRQLLQNLVANAVKFRAEAAPVVRISAEQAEDAGRAVWRFAVADNGIGIEEHHADRVFQIFQRLHTRDEYEGTGIGLAMCKKIVERHGGRIWFESAPDAAASPTDGTTFYFTLPTAPPPDPRAHG